MRRAFFFLISLLLLALFFIQYSKNSTFAQEKIIETETPIGIDAMEATGSSMITNSRINYEFPYPGMLPDHPFYFLKVFRDGVVKMLINDSMKLARFNLMNSEKRMYAGKLLVDKNKDKLAMTTISKGNKYLDESISALISAKRQNPRNTDIRLFSFQLKSSIQKHLEILRDMKTHVDGAFQQAYRLEEERLISNQKTVENLLLQK